MTDDLRTISKFLSLVLRHQPESIGLSLDQGGWADVDILIARAAGHGMTLDRELIARVVATSDKQRFALSEDGSRIRANQGHSIPVDLGLAPALPPDHLFHGTADRFLDAILKEGLVRRRRHHVHLSPDAETALNVGKRHGHPIILEIAAGRMAEAGYVFFRSANGVWLTDHVPVQFLQVWSPKDGAS